MTLSSFPFVLLVDDDRADQKLAKRALATLKQDISMYVAGSAEEALVYLQRCQNRDAEHPLPHVILLDLNMPGMGGKAMLRQIKTSNEPSRIPVFILTTSDSETDRDECYELGAAGYIQKPASRENLRKVMTMAAEHWAKAPLPADELPADTTVQ
ncbi:MAG: response regulator [Sedimentisphaerales bacterium]|nr:response regulator [Sedimentisphaerales bacterium]